MRPDQPPLSARLIVHDAFGRAFSGSDATAMLSRCDSRTLVKAICDSDREGFKVRTDRGRRTPVRGELLIF
jgi:hypothetical protein